ncbi:MAG: exodeoxyribonuclease III [Sulfurospirillum sp.]|nr:MAG: exodeoxyribonuclease III [Sulfurospirillum sp.]
MRFISWNVNGIRAVARKEALKWIDEYEIDLLALQEIKASSDQIPKSLFEKEFQTFLVSSSYKKGQSGVATYCDMVPNYKSKCYEVDILKEGRINEVHFGKLAFFNVYFPNGQRSIERLEYKLGFYDRFLEYINDLKKRGYSIIFCGDINTAHKEIDLARAKENENTSGFLKIEREWIDRVINDGYVDTFRFLHPQKIKYSWWSQRTRARQRNVGWRIDYFFVSSDLKAYIKEADILTNITGSDHAPVELVLEREPLLGIIDNS